MKFRYFAVIALLVMPLAACGGLNDLVRHYNSGPEGGCYYNNDSGNKVYVDHSYCNS